MPVATPITRSRASRTLPTYTSAARSAMLRPWAAVVRAAWALADAAWRVWFLAVLRVRRPVDFAGDLAAVRVLGRDAVRVLLREAVLRVVDLRAVLPVRAVDLRAVLLRAVDLVVVLLLVVPLALVAMGKPPSWWLVSRLVLSLSCSECTLRTPVCKPAAGWRYAEANTGS